MTVKQALEATEWITGTTLYVNKILENDINYRVYVADKYGNDSYSFTIDKETAEKILFAKGDFDGKIEHEVPKRYWSYKRRILEEYKSVEFKILSDTGVKLALDSIGYESMGQVYTFEKFKDIVDKMMKELDNGEYTIKYETEQE